MRVTESEIIKMNELYLQYGTYAAVAREVGRSPSTVKRYIQSDFQVKEEPIELKSIDWDKLSNAPLINIFSLEWEND